MKLSLATRTSSIFYEQIFYEVLDLQASQVQYLLDINFTSGLTSCSHAEERSGTSSREQQPMQRTPPAIPSAKRRNPSHKTAVDPTASWLAKRPMSLLPELGMRFPFMWEISRMIAAIVRFCKTAKRRLIERSPAVCSTDAHVRLF